MSSSGPPEPVPPAAAELFGPRLPLAVRYVELLADAGVVRGLIGPREVPRLWERHVLNSAVLESLIPPGSTVADVGSGAGLPGIPLAIARPDLAVTLVEPLERRVTFLREVEAELGLGLEVWRGRAEQWSGPPFDVVAARALAPLERLAAWCLPLARRGGVVLAQKGRTAEVEVDTAKAALRGCRVEIRTVGAGLVDPPATVVTITRPPRPERKHQ